MPLTYANRHQLKPKTGLLLGNIRVGSDQSYLYTHANVGTDGLLATLRKPIVRETLLLLTTYQRPKCFQTSPTNLGSFPPWPNNVNTSEILSTVRLRTDLTNFLTIACSIAIVLRKNTRRSSHLTYSEVATQPECSPLYTKYNFGTTVWSPLASGVLSGKVRDLFTSLRTRIDSMWSLQYNDGIPPGSRLANHPDMFKHIVDDLGASSGRSKIEKMQALAKFAKEGEPLRICTFCERWP